YISEIADVYPHHDPDASSDDRDAYFLHLRHIYDDALSLVDPPDVNLPMIKHQVPFDLQALIFLNEHFTNFKEQSVKKQEVGVNGA
ncbi:hypothetical protein, partial [Klebsiella pneumoniae]|uniref:hypothetical protein n=1 Tax=Klebsiella pneumoniae TaxID=573 RepID=UPI003F521E44